MTLRPNDYDRNGDIIPSGWKEEKGDLISRSALKEELANLLVSIDYLVNKTTIADKELAIFSVIDNAPTVEPQKGEWKFERVNVPISYAKCPFCDFSFEIDRQRWLPYFCGGCGADMRTKEGDNK